MGLPEHFSDEFHNNRRQIPRLVRQPEHSWQLAVDGDVLITKNITNISPTGLSFKAPLAAEFKPGQILKINFSLSKDENFDCEAKVVWSKEGEEITGSMRLLGVQFLRIPARVDTAIMKEINEQALKGRRAVVAAPALAPTLFPAATKRTIRSLVLRISGILAMIAMTAALIASAYLHQRSHPQESIEYQFNHALFNKLLKNQ